MAKIYYISKEDRLEALTTLSFKRTINWLEEGMSLLSWNYSFVLKTELEMLPEIYNKLRRWKGNVKTKKNGHYIITVGDIIENTSGAWIVVGSGFQKIPDIIWEKLNK